MDNTAQWIPLSGQGGRLPTIEDADENGKVWFYFSQDSKAQYAHWTYYGDKRAFMPIPKRIAPPLPKPVEKTQEEKDKETFFKYWRRTSNVEEDGELVFIDGIRYGRADGRKQLAQEALELFEPMRIPGVCNSLRDDQYSTLAKAISRLHELLTKAAEAKP